MAYAGTIPLLLIAKQVRIFTHNRLIGKIIIILIVAVVSASLLLPVWGRFEYRSIITPETSWQSFNTLGEISMSEFLRNNTPPNSVIISDYFTMYMMSPLSNRVWLIDKFIGIDSPAYNETLSKIKYDVLRSPTSRGAYENIAKLESTNCYLSLLIYAFMRALLLISN